jgi:alanine racemase
MPLPAAVYSLHMGVGIEVIRERMRTLQPVNMRLELKKGINHCSVINDSYSADLSSLEIALNFLDQQSSGTKKTVILSDLLQSALPDEELYLANSRKPGKTSCDEADRYRRKNFFSYAAGK